MTVQNNHQNYRSGRRGGRMLTAAIAAIVAIEKTGRKLGRDIDVYGKEVIPILKMFRENIIVELEDVGHAGHFLAKAAMQQLQHPELPLMQHLEIPTDKPE